MTTSNTCGCKSAAARTTESVPMYRPEIDIHETPDEFVVTADLPGATVETLELNIDKGVLMLRAPVPPRDPSGARRLMREYSVGSYERAIRLGEGVDSERISAEFRNGVLTLRAPKSSAARARKIQVQGG